ncbi:MAG: hypothetical protein DCF29_10585 [Alphaproteobacteria bacterium]|nr:MAG: hypothetical protein DCF29_10585 [Alphaproteobacteria bacterium]
MRHLLLAATLAVVATACTAAETEAPQGAASVSEAAYSSAAAATPEPGSSQAAPPLSAYVDKYPFDAVDGVTFIDHPLVRAAIERSGAPAEALEFLRNDNTVVVPIREVDGRLMSRGFEPAVGGDVNWGILISLDGQRGAVCYSTGVVPDVSGADWYIDGEKAFTRYEMCPSEANDLIGFGNWPIGGIPG